MLFPVAINVTEINVPYRAIVPDIEGCTAFGSSIEDAIKNAKEYAQIRLAELAKSKQKIPNPTYMQDHLKNPEYAVGYIWVMIDIDMSLSLGKPIKYNVSISEHLTNRIDVAVKKNKNFKCRSSFLAEGAVILLSQVE
jgi:predicted RNase H-like HicB family nuclease